MQKIILNSCFGGYSWSKEAEYNYIIRKGYKKIRFVRSSYGNNRDISLDEYFDGKDDYDKCILVRVKEAKRISPESHVMYEDDDDWTPFWNREIDREDPVAIQLLEEKGTKYCSGPHARLTIQEYDSENWVADISEYDGIESLDLKPRVTKQKIRDCKNTEEVIKYLETFNLFKYDEE